MDSFADDTQMYCVFTCHKDVAVFQKERDKVVNCLYQVSSWMISNKLKLNCEKTQILLIGGPSKQLSDIPVSSLLVAGTEVQISEGRIRNLGSYF